MWTDINNRYTLYEGNVVKNNDLMGIFHEVSYDVVIRNNTIEGNGFKSTGTMRGGGIAVVSSPNVEIYGNTIRNNQNGIAVNQDERGSGPYGLHEVNNLFVHDNTIVMQSGYTGLGLGRGLSGNTYYTSKNNRFVRNNYTLGTRTKYFYWQDAERTPAQWQAYGQDQGGTFSAR
jgi:parallel beta-helix repeat protein